MGVKRKQHSAEFKARVAMAALSGCAMNSQLSRCRRTAQIDPKPPFASIDSKPAHAPFPTLRDATRIFSGCRGAPTIT